MFPLAFLSLFPLLAFAKDCPCGWRLSDTGEVYTHRILDDFSLYHDARNMPQNPRAMPFAAEWMIYDYFEASSNLDISLNLHWDAQNVKIKDSTLILTQRAYSQNDRKVERALSVAGIQTRALNIVHGTFRATMKVSGDVGGLCASFFWYHDERNEIDIEAVTRGTSLVNNTINYTTQPSLDANGEPIPNATLSVPQSAVSVSNLNVYRELRFDCSPGRGVNYYLDGRLVHTDNHNIPHRSGSLQLKLWADGNRWWSGVPSTTDVHLSVKNIMAYFNTTTIPYGDVDMDEVGDQACLKAGGPSDETLCEAEFVTDADTQFSLTSLPGSAYHNGASCKQLPQFLRAWSKLWS